ncbi:MAG: Cro/Cl family transcriptional regulator [Candidatus Symbiopectobacterium sp. Dall1.0]|nr:Cro/Cl family transcriptional regulator [Candidatus Symbiopectobacterium sp. Dall1.0]
MKQKTRCKLRTLASQSDIARHLGVTPQAVSLWFKSRVPARYIRALCAFLEWRVTPHELNGEIYPNPDDALPILKIKPKSPSPATTKAK